MKHLKYLLVLSFVFGCLNFAVVPAMATDAPQTVELDNPIQLKDSKNKVIKDEDVTPAVIIGMVIKSFLGLLGGLALVMMVWGGFQWLTSAGNDEKVKKGTQTMMWAIIGMVIVLASYLLVSTVLRFLSGSTA
jgi:hypothetical protein